MDQESLKYWIALRAVEEVGCVGFRTLLQAFSTPREVFSATAQTLRVVPGIGPKTADHIRSFSDWGMAEREIERARELEVAIITCEDPTYPGNLLNIYDYPPLLYVKGSLNPEEICVAVVGSRLASVYGRYTTEKISRELALQGITVVSGLARGIDAAAHRGALAGKGRTIGFWVAASTSSIRRRTRGWQGPSLPTARSLRNSPSARRPTPPISRRGTGSSAASHSGSSSWRPARKAAP